MNQIRRMKHAVEVSNEYANSVRRRKSLIEKNMMERIRTLSTQLMVAKDGKLSDDSIKTIFERYLMRDETAAGRINSVFKELEGNRAERESLPWLSQLAEQTKDAKKKKS